MTDASPIPDLDDIAAHAIAHAIETLTHHGATIREEWGVRLTRDDTDEFEDHWGDDHWGDSTREFAEQRRNWHLQRRNDTPTHGLGGVPAGRWRVMPTLLRRYVITTAASPVTETDQPDPDRERVFDELVALGQELQPEVPDAGR